MVQVTHSFMPNLEEYTEEIKEANDIFYLGSGVDYSLAMEGALKIIEKIKYIKYI